MSDFFNCEEAIAKLLCLEKSMILGPVAIGSEGRTCVFQTDELSMNALC
jgi:hypothetical protein